MRVGIGRKLRLLCATRTYGEVGESAPYPRFLGLIYDGHASFATGREDRSGTRIGCEGDDARS
jgi:hypothetical protein